MRSCYKRVLEVLVPAPVTPIGHRCVAILSSVVLLWGIFHKERKGYKGDKGLSQESLILSHGDLTRLQICEPCASARNIF